MRVIILFLLLQHFSAFANDNFQHYRQNLALATEDKELCNKLIFQLEKQNKDSKARGYLGAYTMIKANHVFSLIQKLKFFNTGKDMLEESISKLPNDIELRYIRYAIQISVPKFLGYSKNRAADKKVMMDNIKSCHKNLQTDILQLLRMN